MTPLEEELVAGMREHTAGLAPAPDLIDLAVRGNRRRRARFAAAGGGLGVAAVLAVVIATVGSPPPGPADQGSGVRPAPKMLTVAEISSRALAAMANDDVEHVMVSVTQNGSGFQQEFWYDSVTGNSRTHSVRVRPGERIEDSWTFRASGQATVNYVNHTDRTWWTLVRSDDNGKTGSQAPYTPDELRAQLRDGVYQLAGDEQLDGRAVVHLHAGPPDGPRDLWVDADTFRPVRRQIIKGGATITADFDWQARTPESLQPFTFTPPAGYTQAEPS